VYTHTHIKHIYNKTDKGVVSAAVAAAVAVHHQTPASSTGTTSTIGTTFRRSSCTAHA